MWNSNSNVFLIAAVRSLLHTCMCVPVQNQIQICAAAVRSLLLVRWDLFQLPQKRPGDKKVSVAGNTV